MEARTPDDFFRQPIFVVSCGRSGSSMVMGLLHRAGLWVGECLKGSPENPAGFFENIRLKDGVVKPILSIHGYDKKGMLSVPEETLSFYSSDIPELVKDHLESDGYQYHVPWGYKDSKLLLMWASFHKAFPKARWVIVQRNREDTLASMKRTGFINTPEVRKEIEADASFLEKRVDRYQKGIDEIKNCAGLQWYTVDADEIISGNYGSLINTIEACGLRFNEERARKFVDPKIWNRTSEQMHKEVLNEDGRTKLSLKMGMNAGRGYILDNIQLNIQRQLPQAKEYITNDTRIAIIGGGPSLSYTTDELQRCVDDGAKLVALNGTHDWLLDHGYRPSAMVMVDSRPENVRFVQRPVDTCKYFISSQCHPDVFEALKDNEVHIWHASNGIGEEQILEDYYYKNFRFCIGGSTVLLRAIWLMRMLGFIKMDVFGFDSCYMNGKHHAYEQPENDGCEIKEITCMGETFQCAAWMASQFEDFQHFIKKFGDKFELNVHGAGLVSHMMREGANLFEQENKSAIGK